MVRWWTTAESEEGDWKKDRRNRDKKSEVLRTVWKLLHKMSLIVNKTASFYSKLSENIYNDFNTTESLHADSTSISSTSSFYGNFTTTPGLSPTTTYDYWFYHTKGVLALVIVIALVIVVCASISGFCYLYSKLSYPEIVSCRERCFITCCGNRELLEEHVEILGNDEDEQDEHVETLGNNENGQNEQNEPEEQNEQDTDELDTDELEATSSV